MPACDGRTDRQTDGRTDGRQAYSYYVLQHTHVKSVDTSQYFSNTVDINFLMSVVNQAELRRLIGARVARDVYSLCKRPTQFQYNVYAIFTQADRSRVIRVCDFVILCVFLTG